MDNPKNSESNGDSLDSERAISISRLDRELATAIRKKQDLAVEGKIIATDPNSTLLMILSSQVRHMKVQQRITHLLLCRNLIDFDAKGEIDVEWVKNLIE